jgi:hypothetical protein
MNHVLLSFRDTIAASLIQRTRVVTFSGTRHPVLGAGRVIDEQ